jgi:hypothetical protein
MARHSERIRLDQDDFDDDYERDDESAESGDQADAKELSPLEGLVRDGMDVVVPDEERDFALDDDER